MELSSESTTEIDADARRAEERLERLHRELHGRVLAYVMRRTMNHTTADEIAAEAFVVAWRRRDEPVRDELAWLLVWFGPDGRGKIKSEEPAGWPRWRPRAPLGPVRVRRHAGRRRDRRGGEGSLGRDGAALTLVEGARDREPILMEGLPEAIREPFSRCRPRLAVEPRRFDRQAIKT